MATTPVSTLGRLRRVLEVAEYVRSQDDGAGVWGLQATEYT